MRVLLFALFIFPAFAAAPDVPSADLYRGWLNMYDLKFEEAHKIFVEWKQVHSADPLGPVSNAAAFLFFELGRLGALEAELFTDDARYQNRSKLHPDPQMRKFFDGEIDQANRLADAALQATPADTNALFAKSLTFGLRADFAAMIDNQDLAALKFTKQGRVYADKLMAVDPKAYDAYLGAGVENYLLSLKPAPLRFLLKLTGSQVDREKGVEQLRMTAQQGHFLEPFAKLLLAVAAIRDNHPATARAILSELHTRFPDNQLYLQELNRLAAPSR